MQNQDANAIRRWLKRRQSNKSVVVLLFASHSRRKSPGLHFTPRGHIEPAAPPRATRRRDFVPWRFSDAGRRGGGADHLCRRPKTRTGPDLACKKCGSTKELRL